MELKCDVSEKLNESTMERKPQMPRKSIQLTNLSRASGQPLGKMNSLRCHEYLLLNSSFIRHRWTKEPSTSAKEYCKILHSHFLLTKETKSGSITVFFWHNRQIESETQLAPGPD